MYFSEKAFVERRSFQENTVDSGNFLNWVTSDTQEREFSKVKEHRSERHRHKMWPMDIFFSLFLSAVFSYLRAVWILCSFSSPPIKCTVRVKTKTKRSERERDMMRKESSLVSLTVSSFTHSLNFSFFSQRIDNVRTGDIMKGNVNWSKIDRLTWKQIKHLQCIFPLKQTAFTGVTIIISLFAREREKKGEKKEENSSLVPLSSTRTFFVFTHFFLQSDIICSKIYSSIKL